MRKINFYAQVIILAGIISFILTGCSKEKNKATNNNTTQTTSKTGTGNKTSQYFITGLLGGKTFTVNGAPSYYSKSFLSTSDSVQMQYACGGAWGGNNHQGGRGGSQTPGYQQPGQNQNNSGTVLITGVNWLTGGTSSDSSSIQSTIELRQLSVRVYVAPIAEPSSQYYTVLVTNQNYAFLSDTNSNTGVVLALRDNTGTLWTTDGDQTGSSFQLTTIGSNQEQYTAVSGTVTAKLYDGNGNSVTLSNTAFTTLVGL